MHQYLTITRGDDDHFWLSSDTPLSGSGQCHIKTPTGVVSIPVAVHSDGIALKFQGQLTKDWAFDSAAFEIRINQDGLIDTVLVGTLSIQDSLGEMIGTPNDTFRPSTPISLNPTPAKIIDKAVDDTDYLAHYLLAKA